MLETNPIQVMGRGTNVDFSIDDEIPIEVAKEKLTEYLKENRLWCSSGVITVNVGRRMLVPEEISEIKQVLDRNSGLEVARFWCAPSIMEEALTANLGFGVGFSPTGRPTPAEEPVPEAPAPQATRRSSSPPVDQESSVDFWSEPAPEPAVDSSPTSPADRPEALDEEEEHAEPDATTGPIFHADSRPTERERLQHNQGVLEETEEAQQPEIEPKIEPPILPVPGPWDDELATEELLKSMYPKAATSGLNRGNEALLIKTTCRSGEVIRYAGDVVVFADVNPGAEIIADGDIVVFGTLRGLAHAGASGDVQATITAMKLETPRLQIGPYNGVNSKPNQSSKSNRISPKIAYVRRRGVYVSPFAGRFAGYSGGTPYGG